MTNLNTVSKGVVLAVALSVSACGKVPYELVYKQCTPPHVLIPEMPGPAREEALKKKALYEEIHKQCVSTGVNKIMYESKEMPDTVVLF